MGIRGKILSIAAIILIIGIAAEVVTCGYIFTREYSLALQFRAFALGEGLRSQLDRIFSLGISLNELVGFEKQCQELVERDKDIDYAMVSDLNGRVLFHSDRSRHPDQVRSPLAPDMGGKRGSTPYTIESEGDYQVVVPVLNSQDEMIAAILIGVRASILDEKISHLIKYSAIVSLLTLSVAVALLFLALRLWVTKPLSELFDAIRQLRKDERGFYDKIRVAARDEIGHVSSAFNILIENLNTSHEMITLHTEKLESTVDQRTAELRELNEQLERDIAERKKIEEALRESETNHRRLSQEFHTLLNALPDAICWYSPDLRIMWANRYSAKMAGKNLSLVKNEKCYEAWHNRTAPCEVCAVQTSLKTGEPSSALLHRPDGRILETRAIPFRDADGNVVSVIEIGRDVTEQRKLEAQLRQAQKLEAIGTIAGGIAHDFNNILAAILGYTEMSLFELPEKNPIRNNLEHVLQASQRAKELVKQILAFSRHQDLEQNVPVDIALLIKECLGLLRASLPTTIEIRQNICTKEAIALANPSQIHQVIINLCTNAAHAMEEKGGILEVSLSALYLDDVSLLHFPHLKPGPHLKIAVSDMGHGMDRATMERIFDPYFTTKAVGKGSGLGLAVVHGIVKRHNGAIKVYSEPGQGSNFCVLLPRIDSKPLEMIDESPVPTGHEMVLLVDDEEVLTEMGREILKTLGYDVVTANGSAEALTLFRKDPALFDVVITDYTMPQMTGEDLTREILKIRPDMPVILATGFSERITEERAGSIGFRNFIMKPLTRRELGSAIRGALNDGVSRDAHHVL